MSSEFKILYCNYFSIFELNRTGIKNHKKTEPDSSKLQNLQFELLNLSQEILSSEIEV